MFSFSSSFLPTCCLAVSHNTPPVGFALLGDAPRLRLRMPAMSSPFLHHSALLIIIKSYPSGAFWLSFFNYLIIFC